MLFLRITLSMCLLFATALAVDVAGTWKLNTSKSQWTGALAPKELTVLYTPNGSGWRYEATGIGANGSPIRSSFEYAKDGEDVKTTGFPMWDTIVITNGHDATSGITFKRAGQKVGTGSRVVSADGKSMTIRADLNGPDGKKVSYVSVYEKQ